MVSKIDVLNSIEQLLGNDEEAPSEEEQAAPAEAQEETAEEAEEESPAPEEKEETPSLPPPAGWDAEAQEWFKSLPPDKQEIVLKRERELRSNESRRSNEHAEAIKAVQQEREQIVQERQQHINQLQNLIPALQAQIAGEFKDIKTLADLDKMAREDPSRYVQWQAKQAAVHAATQEQARLQSLQNQEAQKREAQWVAQQEERLLELIPEWSDHSKGSVELADVRAHMKERGIDPKLADSIKDATMIAIARDAMLYRRGLKAAKTVKVSPPKVLKSGSPSKGGDEVAVLEKQFRKSGSLRDGAKLLERIL